MILKYKNMKNKKKNKKSFKRCYFKKIIKI